MLCSLNLTKQTNICFGIFTRKPNRKWYSNVCLSVCVCVNMCGEWLRRFDENTRNTAVRIFFFSLPLIYCSFFLINELRHNWKKNKNQNQEILSFYSIPHFCWILSLSFDENSNSANQIPFVHSKSIKNRYYVEFMHEYTYFLLFSIR